MPVYVTRSGRTEWYKKEPVEGISLGTNKGHRERVEIRREKTIECTARAEQMRKDGIITNEEFEDALAKNAFGVGLEPEQLRESVQSYIESQKETETRIERE
ncbi:MAG: hypothetical protein RBT33_03140 [Candidatus Dojkabacteria bacterium]|jgi:hypothetical protein|nr:hypothetical protein [Candidatus Dojkabacteria bacterium]